MKKIIAIIICIASLALSFAGCSTPPEYAEVEARFIELINASFGVNEVLFGDGLPTYEKVYEPQIKIYRDKDDKVQYYYEIEDAELGTLYAWRTQSKKHYIASEEKLSDKTEIYSRDGVYYYEIEYTGGATGKVESFESEDGNTYFYYVIEDAELGKIFEYRRQIVRYFTRSEEPKADKTPDFENENGYFYETEYTEKKYEFYYNSSCPDGYSFVRLDCEFKTTDDIKKYAESVYSAGYLKGVYEGLFVGNVILDENSSAGHGARYSLYEDQNGTVWLVSLDNYEFKLAEPRVYDFSTARVVSPGSSDFVNIEIECYTASNPSDRETEIVSMVKQEDGKWYLDTPTY